MLASDIELLAMLDVLPASAALLDQSGDILGVNNNWRQFGESQGLAPDDVPGLGNSYIAVCEAAAKKGDHVAAEVLEGVNTVLSNKCPKFELVYPCHSPDGGERWFHLIVVPLLNPPKGPRGAVAIHFDVTDRELSRLSLHALQAELVNAARAELVNLTTSALAHELNQPLTAISIASGNAKKGTSDLSTDPRAMDVLVESLDILETDALRAGQIVRGLRDLWSCDRLDAFRHENFAELVREASQLAFIDVRNRKFHITVDIPENLPNLHVSRLQIQLVIISLIRNAISALESKAADNLVERVLRLEARAVASGAIEIAVIDNGPGLPAETFAQLSQNFRLSRKSGVRYGLSMCQAIIEAHGGRLWAEATPGGGTTVRFSLQ